MDKLQRCSHGYVSMEDFSGMAARAGAEIIALKARIAELEAGIGKIILDWEPRESCGPFYWACQEWKKLLQKEP